MFTKQAPPFAKKGATKKKGKPAAKTAGPPPAWQGIGNKMLAGKPGMPAC
jgi:hypothetical protein